MDKNVYVVHQGRITIHKIIKETPTGWTIIPNWAKDQVVRSHQKNHPFKNRKNYKYTHQDIYTTTEKTEAKRIAEEFQDDLKCMIRDSEMDVMNL